MKHTSSRQGQKLPPKIQKLREWVMLELINYSGDLDSSTRKDPPHLAPIPDNLSQWLYQNMHSISVNEYLDAVMDLFVLSSPFEQNEDIILKYPPLALEYCCGHYPFPTPIQMDSEIGTAMCCTLNQYMETHLRNNSEFGSLLYHKKATFTHGRCAFSLSRDFFLFLRYRPNQIHHSIFPFLIKNLADSHFWQLFGFVLPLFYIPNLVQKSDFRFELFSEIIFRLLNIVKENLSSWFQNVPIKSIIEKNNKGDAITSQEKQQLMNCGIHLFCDYFVSGLCKQVVVTEEICLEFWLEKKSPFTPGEVSKPKNHKKIKIC